MSEVDGPVARSGRRALAVTFGVLRGILVGAVSLAAAFGLAYAVVYLVIRPEPEPATCGPDELTCIPDLGPLIVGLVIIAVAVPALSPLLAWLVRLPKWWYFVLPGLWVSALAVFGTAATVDSSERSTRA